MIKKFVAPIIMVLAIALVSCNSEKKYKEKLANTVSLIEREVNISGALAYHYSDTWRKAIFDNEYNGEYCSDFNEALAKHKEFIITTDSYKRMMQKKDSIEAIMPQLNDYPSNLKDAYNEIVSIYADADELLKYAQEPTGSLSSYTEKISNLYQKIEKEMKEFKVKYTQNN